MRNRKQDIITILIFFLINLIVKIYAIDQNDISIDEPFSIYHAQMGVWKIIKILLQGNNPPLFEIILHYWIKLFGIGSFSLRLLPVIFSSGSVIFIYITGRKFYSYHVALLASMLFSLSVFQVEFAHEVRVYSLFILLSSISLFLFLSIALSKNSNNKLYSVLLIVTNILLIYAHYFGFFVLLIELMAVISFKEIRTHFLKLYLIFLSIILFFYIPLFAILVQRFIISSHGTWVSPPDITSLYNFVWKLSNAPVTTIIILIVLLSALIFHIFNYKQISVETSTKVLLLWFFFPLLFCYFISFVLAIFLDRYLVYISVAFYLLIAIAISYLKLFKYSSVIISATVVIAMLVSFNPNYGDTVNWKQIASEVKKEKTNETLIVIYPEWLELAFAYHYNVSYFKDYNETHELLFKENIFPVINYTQLDSTKIRGAKKILFICENGAITPNDIFLKSFGQIFPSINTYKPAHGPTMYIFSK